jgi:hypothetical protein
MSLHPGTATYNPAGNSDFTRKAEALALGIANWSTPKATDGAKGGPGQSYGSGGMPPLQAQAAQWPTPAAQNWKGSSEASIIRADGKSRMDILSAALGVTSWSRTAETRLTALRLGAQSYLGKAVTQVGRSNASR